MLVSWTIEYEYDFREDRFMTNAADELKYCEEPITPLILAERATEDCVRELDDYYYYTITDETIDYVKNQFFEKHSQELEEMLLKAGLLKTS